MARTPMYRTADDLIKHCTINDGCILWPQSSDSPAPPVLSPASPMSKAMMTNSVPRILFMLCRHLPAGNRLVKRCSSPNCVNPYHHTESNAVLSKRATLKEKGIDPQSLLPKQESVRHLAYPHDDVLEAGKPKDPEVLGVLMMSASVAGFDAKGLPTARKHHYDVPMADPDKPVLVLKKRPEPKPEPEKEEMGEDVDAFFDMIEKGLLRQSTPRKYGMDA
jgi:hypothetical protein